MRFTRAMVSVSLCCPSRTTILRGQYAHNTGVETNGGTNGGFEAAYRFGVERSTVATWLHARGLPHRAHRQVPERVPEHRAAALPAAGLDRRG